MSRDGFLNLYVYNDSIAFRRNGQPQDLNFTYPFLLKQMIEAECGLRANLLVRGGAGLTIREIKERVTRDCDFFGGDPKALNIAVLQFGIVDCAPRPVTYPLRAILDRTPVIGPKVLASLVRHRRGIQRLWHYHATSKKQFKRNYEAIIYLLNSVFIRPLSMGLPLPPFAMEHRSPGFRRSASLYNEVIKEVAHDSFCDIEGQMTESLREQRLLPDGHHLTEEGHRFYADVVFDRLRKLV